MATPSNPRLNLIEERLLYLEGRDEVNSRDILKLKKENLDLQNVVVELKRKNSAISKEKRTVTTRLNKFESETKDSISHLSKEVSILRGLQKTLNVLMVKCAESGMEAMVKTLQGKVNTLEGRVTETEDKVKSVKASMDRLQAVEKKVATNQNRLDATQSQVQSLGDRLTQTNKKVKTNEAAIKTLDGVLKSTTQAQDIRAKSAFCVDVRLMRKIKDGRNQVDTFIRQNLLCAYFDKDDCTYKVPIDGNYWFGGDLSQRGDGRLELSLCFGDGTERVFMVGTCKPGWKFGSTVQFLTKGTKVSLEVLRTQGEAVVNNEPTFYGFLI